MTRASPSEPAGRSCWRSGERKADSRSDINDVDVDILSGFHQPIKNRGARQPAVPGLAALADNDDLDGIFLGEGPHHAGDVGSSVGHGNAAERPGQFEVLARQALRAASMRVRSSDGVWT